MYLNEIPSDKKQYKTNGLIISEYKKKYTEIINTLTQIKNYVNTNKHILETNVNYLAVTDILNTINNYINENSKIFADN